MPFDPRAAADRPELPRCGVVDLGSNSVRMVVFEGTGRTPVAIFNEKAVLRLGRGLQASGMLNPEGIPLALTVMDRYAAVARAMGAYPFDVLATAAVRDARNGAELVAAIEARLDGVRVQILTGQQEAALSAEGLLCGIPDADGVLADIGGGSMEVVRVAQGCVGATRTLRLGVIRLSERAGGDLARARELAEADLADVEWLEDGMGRDLYLVGGAWRGLARLHIAATGYPLNIIHHYSIDTEAARELTQTVIAAPRRTLERMPGVPRRRVDDLPYAAVVLRRLLRSTGARRVVFSANGLREGWYLRRIQADLRAQDGLLAACRDYAMQLGREPALPPALLAWTDVLFPHETEAQHREREAACWVSDIGSHDHPEYRAEQAFLRILRQPGAGMDHHVRAFLALTVAIRYDADSGAGFVAPIWGLLSAEALARATVLGCALRLAYTLSAGTVELLDATRLRVDSGLHLDMTDGSGVFAGEGVTRRLDRLRQAMGVVSLAETTVPSVA